MKTWLGFLLVVRSAVGAPAESYTIRMAPPVEVGSRYSVSATGHRSAKTSVGERVVAAVDYDVSFEGRASVVEVDTRARPVKVVFTVDQFTRVAAGVETVLLKAGTVIIADGKQDPPIVLEEGPLAGPVLEAFKLVYSIHKPDEVTDDDVFGTTERKSAGDRWPMNRMLAVKSFKGMGIVVPEDGLSGSVSLDGKDKVGTVDCLSLRGEMTANGITGGALPEGVVIETGSLKGSLRGCLPLESQGLFRREGTAVQVEIHASKDGMKFDVAFSERRDVVWTPAVK